MKKNMGNLDRAIRLLMVVVIAILAYTDVISGTWLYILLGLAGVYILTSFFAICPLYSLVGVSTCKVKQ